MFLRKSKINDLIFRERRKENDRVSLIYLKRIMDIVGDLSSRNSQKLDNKDKIIKSLKKRDIYVSKAHDLFIDDRKRLKTELERSKQDLCGIMDIIAEKVGKLDRTLRLIYKSERKDTKVIQLRNRKVG